MAQRSIPYMQFRGGSSKGLFFNAADIPKDEIERDHIILQAMEGVGHGDPRQIDGLGGAASLTSKVAIVNRSKGPGTDLDYLFLQVVVGTGHVSSSQNCGNILAAVLPYAIESGMFEANSPITTARINMINTHSVCEVTVESPGGEVKYSGAAKVDGVQGTASPIICNYLDIEGSSCGSLLPTGNARDIVDDTEVTCIDNGMPVVIIRATDVGVTGYEFPKELEANERLRKKLERIRLVAGPLMNLADVSKKTVPKMCVIAPPLNGGMVATRTFIPHTVHDAIGVLGAVSTATACLIPGSVAEGIASISENTSYYSIEHPSGEFTVNLETAVKNGRLIINKSGVIRTARLIAKGEVFLPEGNG
jgi:4-oxalomesaconate tautomerase